MPRRAVSALCVAVLAAGGLGGCSGGSQGRTIRVLAAASLTQAFPVIARRFEAQHPGVHVAFSFAGSDVLAQQIVQGAPADVFASADRAQMEVVRRRGDTTTPPRDFATNRLVVIVPRNDPAGIHSPADLARPGVEVVLAAPKVPAGHYARAVLGKLGIAGSVHVVSNEQDVEGVVSKVRLGEADAGICYVTDVTSKVAPQVRKIAIGPKANVVATYQIAAVSSVPAAADFVRFVDSAGLRVLARYGFGAPPKP